MDFAVNERGFTIVEGLVALVLAVILFVALGASLNASFRSGREARIQEQATQLSIEGVETARSMTWDEVAMSTVEAGDPRVAGSNLKASAADLPGNEALVIDASAGLIDPRRIETLDGQEFVVWQYVTEVDADLRRVVVIVNWSAGGTEREHHTSSLFSRARSR